MHETSPACKINPNQVYSYGVVLKDVQARQAKRGEVPDAKLLDETNFMQAHLPKHRFTDYGKAQVNIQMIERKKQTSLNRAAEQYHEIQDLLATNPHIKKYRRLQYLHPSTKQAKPDTKAAKFPKRQRPELWPVKDEHAEPPYAQNVDPVPKSGGQATRAVSARPFLF